MQSLVYIFVSLSGLAVAAGAYFGLAFTPVQAVLSGAMLVTLAIVMVERTMRRRSEQRMERAIEDLSRLLSTDAQAGQVLSQRINEMTDLEAGPRLEGVEADVSVLGTVVQQVAEAVAEIEKAQIALTRQMGGGPRAHEADQLVARPAEITNVENSTAFSLKEVERAQRDDSIVFHIQSVVTLPQRRTSGYNLLPLIELPNGDFADATDFSPRRAGLGILQAIEKKALGLAMNIARNAGAEDDKTLVYAPLSDATLSEPNAVERMAELLDRSRVAAKNIVFLMTEAHWTGLSAMERDAVSELVRRGSSIALSNVSTLKLDFTELEIMGVTSIWADATRFIETPETYTEFHTADVTDFIKRYGMQFIMEGVRSEQQVLSLVEETVRYATGHHISKPRPIPKRLMTAEPAPALVRQARMRS